MDQFENPITKPQHEYWKSKITERFEEQNFTDDIFLSLIDYIEGIPQKFYSQQAFDTFFDLLSELKNSNPEILKNFINENQNSINRGVNALYEVNQKQIHDTFFPEGDLELYEFIDKDIHYNYLKLLEGPYFLFIFLIAIYSRKRRGKDTEGLDLFNCVQEIEKNYSCLIQVYDNNIRNGIAHGSVIFQDHNLIYTDKKENTKKISKRNIVKKFDQILDLCNGLTLALKVFLFSNSDFLTTASISIPQSILIRELKFQVDGPAWEVLATSDSQTIDSRTQLIVYANNTFWDYNKVQFNCFRTAYLAAKFTNDYDRIFIHLDSKHSKFEKSGWAAFDGKKMKELITINSPLAGYEGVLENNGIMFLPKIKMPKILYTLGSFYMAMKVNMPLVWKSHIDTAFPNPFLIRETIIHSKGRFSAVPDPSVIIRPEFCLDIESLIRSDFKKIVRQVKRHSKKSCSRLSILRYLPIRYLRVFVYEKDLRKRALRNSGLPPELICTIEVNTSKQIKAPDILGGKVETHGKYRIVWNGNWKNEG
jgi:hypothetical protein